MAFVPSSDSQRVLASGKPIGDMLARITGLTFDVQVPTNYTAVIEAVGASKIDVAWLSPFAYALAREKYGADVILSSVRQGSRTYVSQFIAHADSGIKDVRDFQGKRFAFVDAASASGYLYPAAMLRERGFDPARFFSQVVYAGGHDKVVIAVYQKNVDGGATTGRSSMEANAPPTDTRTRVQSTYPDVLQKVRIVAETEPIPNDTVSVRKGLEPAVVDALKTGLLQIAKDPEGQKHLRDLYTIDGLSEAKDSDYDRLRKVAQTLGMSLEQALQPAPMPTTSAAGTPAAGGTPTGTSR